MPGVAASTCCISLWGLSCATHTAWTSAVLPSVVFSPLLPEKAGDYMVLNGRNVI